MNSRQLVANTLAGLPTPRTPSGPLAVHCCAEAAGVTLRRYTTDAGALADSVIRYCERFRPDAIWVSSDTWVSAGAMGVPVGATGDDQPFGALGGPLVRTAADIDRIPPPDVATQGRYPLMLDALGRIVMAVGRDVFIVACFDQYPFSLAAALMDINEIMLKLYDDPPFVQALMQRCEEYALAYGTALAAAGADLLSGGDSPAGLVGPQLYEEVVLPAEQSLIRRLKPAARTPVSLHICGNSTPILPLMAGSGADVLELDHMVDLAQACRIAGPDLAIWGNLDPVSVLARGTPADVERAAQYALDVVRAAGHRRFVLSSGCTLPVGTPGANIDVLIRAARTSGPVG
ncbi:MAG: uroporphyrinogen decarboxylase family protein [Kiritimatiellia bacterium]